ncbi:MAG: HAD family acid phosphatase [Woeseiaceae bacterium]|nr:HAD family acid phosphatase [Woeseiaceae bacterium]
MSRLTPAAFATLFLAGCAATTPEPQPYVHPGITWVRTAAEFDALALQAYQSAGDALADKVGDRSWSALPGQQNAADLPPAVIFDVDETVVSNVEFQLTLIPPFADEKLNAWNAANEAVAIPGVVEFAERARALGVELFFITNRPCMPDDASGDPCPQKAVTTQDINEAGIPVDESRVMLSFEQPGWNKEKKNRRDVIARDYRVIMLMGDDLGDFIPCSRRRAVAPCTEGATIESRARATAAHRDYWGDGWYILPNPMHGSWTTVR